MTAVEGAAERFRGFLGYLPDHERAELLQLGQERSYGAGSFVLLEGDPSTHVVLLLTGQVKVYLSARDGERLLLAIRGPGDVLGELSAFGGEQPKRSATIETMTPAHTRVLGGAEFMEFVRRWPNAAVALLMDVRDRLRNAERLRMEAVHTDTISRVTRHLVLLTAAYGEAVGDGTGRRLHISQTELAGWVGASRESVARAIRSLRKRGLVTTGYRSIDIPDLEALRNAAGPADEP